jgi:hypothetical protein
MARVAICPVALGGCDTLLEGMESAGVPGIHAGDRKVVYFLGLTGYVDGSWSCEVCRDSATECTVLVECAKWVATG